MNPTFQQLAPGGQVIVAGQGPAAEHWLNHIQELAQ